MKENFEGLDIIDMKSPLDFLQVMTNCILTSVGDHERKLNSQKIPISTK